MAWIERRHEIGGFFAIVTTPECDAAIGFVQMTDIHRIDRHAFGGVAILPSHRSMGAGRRAMIELMHIARERHCIRKLLLHVRSDNEAALKLYASLGFDEVGVMRAHYNDGHRYYDVALLERLLTPDGHA